MGATASGKSDLAVDLARKFNGEIISADSRQVYKGLDIGSGKITEEEMKGISHYLLDVISPQKIFDVAQFKKLADKYIEDILKRGKVPILCGGTGFYIQAVIDNVLLPEIKRDEKLRKSLELLSVEELFKKLKKMDSERAKTIDPKNPHRLIRAIEIVSQLGKVPPISSLDSKWDVLQIGIKTDKDVLNKRIEKRFYKRVKEGIIEEAKKLHQKGLSYKRMEEIGLAHKYIVLFLKEKILKEEFIEGSIKEEQKYAKRQNTWFKRDKRIKWFGLEEKKKIDRFVGVFIKK